MRIERIRRATAPTDPAARASRRKADRDMSDAPPIRAGVLGIPEGEFTPGVRRAISALIGEARALRDELDRTRVRLADIEQTADRDQLLPVLNRRAFMRELIRQIASIARYRTPATFVYFDLDGLKRINDTFGHPCGDAVLAHFAALLLANVRECDAVGRLGGDEFGVILTHANEQQAEKKCALLAGLLSANPAIWESLHFPLSFSFGALELSGDINAETAVARADAAMYQRKREAMVRR